jgi:septal ring factor EnvC (AmiA/AmiB activator)
MNTAGVVAAILGATVPMLVAGASLLWFIYRRGIAVGAELAKRQADERRQAESSAKIDALERLLTESRAKVEALERLLTETRAELAALQSRRKRSFAKREHTLTAS